MQKHFFRGRLAEAELCKIPKFEGRSGPWKDAERFLGRVSYIMRQTASKELENSAHLDWLTEETEIPQHGLYQIAGPSFRQHAKVHVVAGGPVAAIAEA